MHPFDFLQQLYDGQTEGYLTLTAIHPTKSLPTPSRHIPIADPVLLKKSLDDLLHANALGWGAYFSVGLRKEPLGRWKRGGRADVLSLPALFADIDGDLGQTFARLHRACWRGQLPAPSAMMGSGRGIHLYWRLYPPTTNLALADTTLLGIAEMLGGDKLTVANAMRLPYSHNTKPQVNRPCRPLWIASERRYTLADFAAFHIPKPQLLPFHNRAPPPTTHSGQLNPILVQAVLDALIRDYGAFQQRNGWWGSLCPLGHKRDRPGQHFAFSIERGIGVCQGRHSRLSLKELCTALYLNPSNYGGFYRSI